MEAGRKGAVFFKRWDKRTVSEPVSRKSNPQHEGQIKSHTDGENLGGVCH